MENSPELPGLLRGIDGSVQVTVEDRIAIVSLVGVGITDNGSAILAPQELHREFFHSPDAAIFAVTPEAERAAAPVLPQRAADAFGPRPAGARRGRPGAWSVIGYAGPRRPRRAPQAKN